MRQTKDKPVKKVSAFFSNVRWCFSLSWDASKYYTLIRIISEVLSPILVILAAFIGRYLLNLLAGVWAVDETLKTIILLFSLQLAIAILLSLGRKLDTYCRTIHEDILGNRLSLIIIESAISADVELFDNPDYYDKLQSTGRDSYSLMHVVWNVISCISAAVSFLVSFVILSRANILYGLLMMAAAIPSSIAAARYTKLLYHLDLDQINDMRIMGYYQSLSASKHYVQDIRLYNAGGLLRDMYANKWKELFAARKGMVRKRTVLTTLLDFIPEIAIILISVNIAVQIVNGSGTVGDYSLYSGLVMQLWSAVITLSASIMQVYDNQLKITNFKSLSAFKSRLSDDGKTHLAGIDTVEFDEICFTYPLTEKRVLDKVSFSIGTKEKVALVGLNGSGKSTLIKLLLRLYEPESGRILINGIDIHEFPISEIRRNFSVYFQDMQNYCMTLRENLTIADKGKEFTRAEADAAFNASCGADIMRRSPKGIDANLTKLVDADGIELSGGEHQKVALARTFFRSHSALILDEPSSNLDPEAEEKVFRSLRKLSEGKLTLFTSHRLSNVSLADRIVVLEEGRVVEVGTQKELLKSRSRYSELFRYQQDKYMVNNGASPQSGAESNQEVMECEEKC